MARWLLGSARDAEQVAREVLLQFAVESHQPRGEAEIATRLRRLTLEPAITPGQGGPHSRAA